MPKHKTPSSTAKRRSPSFKEVINTFLIDGVEGVERLENVSKFSIAQAVKTLRDRGRACDDLDELYAKRFGAKVGVYPPKVPKVDEVRIYRSTIFRDNHVVNRIHVSTIGNPERVRVTHLRNKIVIEPFAEEASR